VSLGGIVRRRRVKVQGLEGLGCDPGRCATANGFIPSFAAGVYFDSSKSQWAMGSLQPSSSVATAGDEEVEPWWFRFAKVPGTLM
jgi:hypothetical protein